jgi:hypothetical protein
VKVLSEKELAVELNLSPWTVRTLRLQAGLPHFRTAGRVFYRLESVKSWMDAQEQANQKHDPELILYGKLRRVE